MKRLNVLPPELAGVQLRWWREDPWLAWGMWGTFLFIAALGSALLFQQLRLVTQNQLWERRKEEEKMLNYQLFEQRQRVALIRSSLESLEEEHSLLDQKLRFLLKHKQVGPFWSKILEDVSDVFLKKAKLLGLKGTGKTVIVEGEAPDHQTVTELIARFNERPKFQNVRLNFTDTDAKGEQEGFHFEIASDLA